MTFTQKLQNASIEKMNEAGGKRRYARSFAKRAKSLDLKYTFWEVPSIFTIARYRQTQTLMSIVKQNSQNVTTIDSWCQKTPVALVKQQFKRSAGNRYRCAVSKSGQNRATETVCWFLKVENSRRHGQSASTCLSILFRVLLDAKRPFLDTFSAVKRSFRCPNFKQKSSSERSKKKCDELVS